MISAFAFLDLRYNFDIENTHSASSLFRRQRLLISLKFVESTQNFDKNEPHPTNYRLYLQTISVS